MSGGAFVIQGGYLRRVLLHDDLATHFHGGWAAQNCIEEMQSRVRYTPAGLVRCDVEDSS